jgi:predicted nuclease of predicted toxin-antitoxin system
LTIRFHFDEHVPRAVARGLRRRGIDVSMPKDVELLSADDPLHIDFALQTERVIVTHDRDYLTWHASGGEHAGIAYCHQQKYSIGELLNALLLLSDCYTAEEMHGRLEFL